MGPSRARRGGLLLLASAVLLPLAVQSTFATAALQTSSGAGLLAPQTLSADAVSAAMEADGTVVRSSSTLKVESIDLPEGPGVPNDLYRVTVTGRFPPRALRYVVVVEGEPVGYGIPTVNQRAVRALTTDRAVLVDRVSVRYDGKPVVSVEPEEGVGGRPVGPRATPPRARGPHDVTSAVYNLGDEVFQPSRVNRKVELAGKVHYPSGTAGAPYPLVLFMHGNHSTCYRKFKARSQWPCREGWKRLRNYAGYDYVAERLASYGYVVASVSANGINVVGNSFDDTGMRQRGEVLERHMELWEEWSTTGGGPFGSEFIGRIDLDRIGTMGHSRGGEGVVWNKIVDEERDEPFGVDAVLALAPVDFTRATINEATFAVVLPTCDGDVSDLQGVHFFDDSRYLVPGDPSPKHTVTAFGANHNFFNTVWSPSSGLPGSFDDGEYASCWARITERQQRRVGVAYISGFFRRYLGGDMTLDRRWTGAATPRSIAPARTHVSYLAPDTVTHRVDVDRFTDSSDVSVNELGGAVVADGLTSYGWCANKRRSPCMGDLSWRDIHHPGLSQGALGWSNRLGRLTFGIPEGRGNVSGFDAFQFRATMDPNRGADHGIQRQDLVVVLVDANGDRAKVAASEVGNEALAHPFDGREGLSTHIILNQVRFPLDLFEDVNLGAITAVELRTSRTKTGVINIADVAFSRGG